MNIIIGKIGKSLLFDETKWGAIGGDGDAVKLYINMIHRHPEHQFYILGRSDYSRLTETQRSVINIHNNVHDIWYGFKGSHSDGCEVYIDYVRDMMDKLPQMDSAVIVSGPMGSSNVAGVTKSVTSPDKFTSPLEMTIKYASFFVWYLNKTRIPYVYIHNDPRYARNKAYDFFHHDAKVFSQLNEDVTFSHCTDYSSTEKVKVNQHQEYAPVATASLIGRKDEELTAPASLFSEPDKPRDKFIVVLNEATPSRYPIIKDSILDHVDDVEIYGKWTHEDTINDDRFKGALPFWELQKKLKECKYTLCIPIKKGWSTLKFWECVHAGIIPFMHRDYDTQKNIPCNDFLRVKDSKQLFERIEYLENNPDKYLKLLAHLKRDVLTDEIYDGSLLDKVIMDAVDEIAK